MTITKDCLHCGKSFTARRASARFCSQRCQEAAARKRRKTEGVAALSNRECPQCHVIFMPARVDKRFCGNKCCVKFNKAKHTRPATNLPAAVDSTVTARLFADGFYLGGLLEELERVRKTPGIVASLESQLRMAMVEDAIWPIGKVGRAAVALALLKDNSLLAMPVKWRHPHEARRRPGEYPKVTGASIHLHRRART